MESRQSGVTRAVHGARDGLSVVTEVSEDLSVTTFADPPSAGPGPEVRDEGEAGGEVVDSVLSASRALLAVVVRSLAPVLEELTPGQLRALVILRSQGAQRAGVLAGTLGVHPSTFTRTVDRLAAGGWVTRSENPDSRREVIVELTPRGEHAVASVRTGRRRELDRILSTLPAEEQERVAAAFLSFARACGEPELSELAMFGG